MYHFNPQVYPENAAQAEMMVAAAMRVGFSGGLVVDFPHSTRAKKYFLVLMVGTSTVVPQVGAGVARRARRGVDTRQHCWERCIAACVGCLIGGHRCCLRFYCFEWLFASSLRC